MWWRGKCRRLWLVGLLITIGAVSVIWIWQGPLIVFRIQLWLLVHGGWSDLDNWVVHADRYLPYLVEEAGNTTPIRSGMVRLTNRAEDAFERHRYLRVETVSDCVRIVLHATVGSIGDEFGYSHEEGATNAKRQQAGAMWRRWYQKHKHRLQWDSRRKVFIIRSRE